MFTDLPDLAARGLGGAVLAANDESFADKESLIRDAEPVFTPRSFGHKGQIYDGWETRRRRAPGHDWAVLRLGVGGVVAGVVVDTAFFKGNFPPRVSVDGCAVDGYPSTEELLDAHWWPLIPATPVTGDARHPIPVLRPSRCTHVRLNLLPDGGVARLRVHGEPVPDPSGFAGLPMDLAALVNGAMVLDASNAFYSRPGNAILPGQAACQADGWETSRRREPGNEWLRVRLAGRGVIAVAELDTSHLKFNAPGQAGLRGFDADSGGSLDDEAAWFELLPPTRLQPDTPHRFRPDSTRPATHVRLDVYPDGGMARLRLFGSLTPQALDDLRTRFAGLTLPGEVTTTAG